MLRRIFGYGNEDSEEKMEVEQIAAKKSPKKRTVDETETAEPPATAAASSEKEVRPEAKKPRKIAPPPPRNSPVLAFVPRQTKSKPNTITEPIGEWNSKSTLAAMRQKKKKISS